MLKRTFLTALGAVAIALAVPSMAAAAHHSRTHHKARHARTRHHHSHHAAAALTTASAPVAGGQPAVVPHSEGTSTSPGTTTPTPPAPAGTVASFTGGVLTINLTGGGTQSGQVTEETSIGCVSSTPPPSTEGADDQSEQAPTGSTSPLDAVHTLGTPAGDEQGKDGQEEGQSGQDDGQDNQQGQSGQDGPDGTPCTTAALTPGAVVGVAELNVTGSGAVWDRITIIQ